MPTSNVTRTPGVFLTAVQGMLAGLETSVPSGMTQLTVNGTVATLAAITTELQGYETVYQAAEDAAAAYATAVQARDAAAHNAILRFEGIRAAMKAAIGKTSPLLLKFGMTPQKSPPPETIAQKQERAAKAKATRAARGTLGKRQKAAIKGTVPAATAPATAAAPSPTPPAKTGTSS